MIQSVLDEITASAIATLPGKIGLIAAQYGEPLDCTFATYDWWQDEAGALKLSFPALSVTWAQPTRTGLRNPHDQRPARHGVTLSYAIRSLDMAYIRRHITRVPEAMLLWLDEFPIASRAPGATIVGLANGRDDVIEITHDLVDKRDGTGMLWAVDVALPIYAVDTALPPRSM